MLEKRISWNDSIGSLVKKGYSVSSVKHTPHKKSMDLEGKETWRHWKAGSDPVVFASAIETSIIEHSETSADGIAKRILREYSPDVLVFQGFKEGSFQKVAIGKVTPRKGNVLTNPTLPRLVGHIEKEVAFERVLAKLPGLDCRKCGFDCRGLAGEVVKGRRKVSACKELSDLDVGIFVDGKRIRRQVRTRIVHKPDSGMLRSLKGFEPGKEVEIRRGRERTHEHSGVQQPGTHERKERCQEQKTGIRSGALHRNLEDGSVFDSTEKCGESQYKNFRGSGIAFSPMEIVLAGATYAQLEEAVIGLEPGQAQGSGSRRRRVRTADRGEDRRDPAQRPPTERGAFGDVPLAQREEAPRLPKAATCWRSPWSRDDHAGRCDRCDRLHAHDRCQPPPGGEGPDLRHPAGGYPLQTHSFYIDAGGFDW